MPKGRREARWIVAGWGTVRHLAVWAYDQPNDRVDDEGYDHMTGREVPACGRIIDRRRDDPGIWKLPICGHCLPIAQAVVAAAEAHQP